MEIRSGSGRTHAVAEAEDTLGPGVASTYRWLGDLPGTDDDPIAFGASSGRLLSRSVDLEDIDGMPRTSAVPASVTPLQPDARPGCHGTYYTVLLPSATGR